MVKDKKLYQCELLCNNLKLAYDEVQYGKGCDHYSMHNVIVAAIVSVHNSHKIIQIHTVVMWN